MSDGKWHAVMPRKDCPHVNEVKIEIPKGINELRCEECDEDEVWLCLTCSKVLCSRYKNEHMAKHIEKSDHPIAVSFSDLSFWCFKCQSYIISPLLKETEQALQKDKFSVVYGQAKPSRDLPRFVPLPHKNDELWSQVEKIVPTEFSNWQHLLPLLQRLAGGTRLVFHALGECISKLYGEEKFFKELFPFMIDLMKKTPQILTKDYPFLRQKENSRIELTKEEVSVFLVNAFFSTLHDFRKGREAWACNEFNFFGLHCSQYRHNQAKVMS